MDTRIRFCVPVVMTTDMHLMSVGCVPTHSRYSFHEYDHVVCGALQVYLTRSQRDSALTQNPKTGPRKT